MEDEKSTGFVLDRLHLAHSISLKKGKELSLRGDTEEQLYAPPPVSSLDQETPAPEAIRDAVSWSAWQDGDAPVPAPVSRQGTIHVCHHSGMGKGSSEINPQAVKVHTKARSHVEAKWDWM